MLGYVGLWVEARPVRHANPVLEIEIFVRIPGQEIAIALGLVTFQDYFLSQCTHKNKNSQRQIQPQRRGNLPMISIQKLSHKTVGETSRRFFTSSIGGGTFGRLLAFW